MVIDLSYFVVLCVLLRLDHHHHPHTTLHYIVSEDRNRSASGMGNVQPSKLLDAKLLDSNTITGLSYLEDGQFAKIYKVEI